MIVKAELAQKVDVDIDVYDLLYYLARYLHIDQYIYFDYGYSKLEINNGKEVLNKYEDTSYHGSISYGVVNSTCDIDEIEAYKHLMELKKIVNSIELKKNVDSW